MQQLSRRFRNLMNTVLWTACGAGAVTSVAAINQIVRLGVTEITASAMILPVLVGATSALVIRYFLHRSNRLLCERLELEKSTRRDLELEVKKRKNMEEDIRIALVDAERANQAKSEFLASMSHELRTPLNAILGFAQMMQFDPKNPLTPNQKRHTEDILEGGNHLLRLVNEILDLARVEANQISLSIGNVDIKDVVADCVNLITPLGDPREIKIINQFSDGPSTLLLTDQTRLKQVLINLLSNAVKFNKDGGTVTIEGKEVVSGFLRITVTDTGMGISKNDYSNVFNLFHRLDTNPMIATEGTGIGLTVSKTLVDQMAGRISFESEVGVGSAVWIDLPLASNENVLIWNDALRVGVDAIDKDHQDLILLLNKLMSRSVNDGDVGEIINKLVDYTRYHFEREEALMEVCEYPDFVKHSVFHRKLIDEVNGHKEAWSKERSQKNFSQFRKFFKNWLFDHVLKQDIKIQPYTKGKKNDILKALREVG